MPLAGQEPPVHAPDVIEKPMLCMDFSFKGVGVKCRYVDVNLDYGYPAFIEAIVPQWEDDWSTGGSFESDNGFAFASRGHW